MSNELNNQVLDKITKVCVCKAITKDKIKTSINNGNNTLEKVVADTGATTGACRGGRCKSKIVELIQNNK